MRLRFGPMACSYVTILGFSWPLTACGGGGGSTTSVLPNGASTATPASGSPVNDPEARTVAVSANMTAAITALSDGGVGASGGGGNGAGLVDHQSALNDFGETRTCTESTSSAAGATPTVTVTRTFGGTFAKLQYNHNADGSESGSTEVWTPGPYFGIKNIAANALTLTSGSVGDVPTTGIPAVDGLISSAPVTSSGQLGSIGFRSFDGSWTGAPVWEVGPGYVGYVDMAKLPPAKTEGMTMYYTSDLPVVTAATTAPTVGGLYSATAMIGSAATTVSNFSVLGLFANGALPSFTTSGRAVIGGMSKAVNQAGTITKAGIPARLYNPPATLVCNKGSEEWPLIGWKFSQNVAGLTRTNTVKQSLTHTFRSGTATVVESGVNTETWEDPATSTPTSNTPSMPYYDENAGVITLTHTHTIGSDAAPNTLAVTYTATATGTLAATAETTITNSTYSSKPFVVTTTRNLNAAWSWVQKSVTSGTVVTSSSQGTASPSATITTTFDNVVFQNSYDRNAACSPVSGTVTTVIAPTDTALATTTTTLHFGTTIPSTVSAPSGVSSTVACSGGATSATNCSTVAETDAPDDQPTGCNF